LIEEAEVVFKKQADVWNAILTHSETFDAEAEHPTPLALGRI